MNLFSLSNYFSTLEDTNIIKDFLDQSTFSCNFNLQDTTKFSRLYAMQLTLTKLYELRKEYKEVISGIDMITKLKAKVEDVKDIVVQYDKIYCFEPTFYTGINGEFTIDENSKKTNFIDILSKLKDNKHVDKYFLEAETTYVEQTISYFHLFHIPTTRVDTSGASSSKGPVYGFVQHTMKNLIDSGFTVKLYAVFDLYGTMKNPVSDEMQDNLSENYLTNGTILTYNFLRDLKRYENDPLLGKLELKDSFNMTDEMSDELITICEAGFSKPEHIAKFYEILQKIEKKRIEVGCIKPTPNNVKSSRGHSVYNFEVTKNTPSTDQDDKWFSSDEEPKKTFITFIDMAGIENPLTIAQKVNVFDRSVELTSQKESMFTWFSPTEAKAGYKLLEQKMKPLAYLVPLSDSTLTLNWKEASKLPIPLLLERDDAFTKLNTFIDGKRRHTFFVDRIK